MLSTEEAKARPEFMALLAMPPLPPLPLPPPLSP
jgi:hypothetical protein